MTVGATSSHSLRLFAARAVAVALLAATAARAQVAEVPYMTGRITDNAEILSPEARTIISETLSSHEAVGSDQIAVLTVPSLEGGRLEEFAAQVFSAWKLGEKGEDNGVLLLISPGDRRIRIEVGAGLQDRLSEAAAGRIIRDLVAPHLQRGDFNSGAIAGVRAIIGQLEGNEPAEPVPPAKGSGLEESPFNGPDLSIPERILLGSFIFGIIGLFTIIGVLTPGVGWFLYLFLIPFWAMFPMIVVGVRGALILLITYVVCFPIAKLVLARARWYRQAKSDLQSKGRAQIGGFILRGGSGSAATWSSS